MKLVPLPLSQRLSSAAGGFVCQPEYLPCLIKLWATLPLQAYFGGCPQELQQLCALLGLPEGSELNYQQAAQRIHDTLDAPDDTSEALELLLAPFRCFLEKTQGR